MPIPLLLYHLVVLSFLLAFLGILVVNLFVLPRLTNYKPPQAGRAQFAEAVGGRASRVAVLVPARNEEANIEACLLSLFAQDYPNMEVWLYDDASTDSTPSIASRLTNLAEGWLHVVTGTGDPPPGWLGKANACHQLYIAMRAHSDPDYLLFTDADVRFAPNAVSCAVGTAQAQRAGLLSLFPRQITLTWAERLAVPVLLHWAVYTFLPLPLAHSSRTGPAFAAANGQFLLFTGEAYSACGGHTAVRSQVLEDVALARAVKGAGHRAILADGGPLVQTRMYNGPAEVWRGYSKNAYAFFGYSPFFLALGIAVLTALYVAPPLFALFAVLFSPQPLLFASLPLAQYGAAALARLLLSVRFSYRLFDAFLHPLSVLLLIAIALNSMRWSLTGKGDWKGRSPLAGK